jgi:hypothetical protein
VVLEGGVAEIAVRFVRAEGGGAGADERKEPEETERVRAR